MELKKYSKGLVGVRMTINDRMEKGFGNICDDCNEEITGDSVYIPVLNQSFCINCGEKFLESHKLYSEDEKYQKSNLLTYFPELRIEYEK